MGKIGKKRPGIKYCVMPPDYKDKYTKQMTVEKK